MWVVMAPAQPIAGTVPARKSADLKGFRAMDALFGCADSAHLLRFETGAETLRGDTRAKAVGNL